MGIKRHSWSLRMRIFHCWSNAGGFDLVFPKVVPRPRLGSSVFLLRWFFSPYPVYMQLRRKLDAVIDTKKEERAKAVHACFERSAVILKEHDSVLLPFHALSRTEGHRLESNEEVAE